MFACSPKVLPSLEKEEPNLLSQHFALVLQGNFLKLYLHTGCLSVFPFCLVNTDHVM